MIIIIAFIDHPRVNFTWSQEEPQSDVINVALMWNAPDSVNPALFSYHVDILPNASYSFTRSRTTVTIEVLLNITYNMSIVATHLCGRAMPIILNAGLFYRE